MEDKLNRLYQEMLSDLLIGYPIDEEKLREMMFIIHQIHFVNFSLDSKAVLKILERYA